MGVLGCGNAKMPGYGDWECGIAGVRECDNARISKCGELRKFYDAGWGVWACFNAGMKECENAGISKCGNVKDFCDAGMQTCGNAGVQEF